MFTTSEVNKVLFVSIIMKILEMEKRKEKTRKNTL